MAGHPLDNPIHASLASRHRGLALESGGVLRYPPEIAPFLGSADGGLDDAALRSLIADGDTALMLGPEPSPPPGWRVAHLGKLAQMICAEPIPEPAGAPIVELGEAGRGDVLALTALVYPHYFRPQTMKLGRYFGIYEDGRLAAMIGERMGTFAFREISAVCVHPDFGGRGHARRLLARLSNDVLAQDSTPFLHVSTRNERALDLYARNGYCLRHSIAFWSLARA